VAITFIETEAARPSTQFSFGRPADDKNPSGRERTLYLTFEDEPNQRTVWHNINRDIQRGRA